MPRWWHRAPFVMVGCATSAAFGACGGKSTQGPDDADPRASSGMTGVPGSNGMFGRGGAAGSNDASRGSGGSGGTGASRSTGGNTGSCTYDGVRYSPGERFGECNQCACDGELGISCDPTGCSQGSGGTGGSMTGIVGAGGESGGPFCEDAPIEAFCVHGIPSGDGEGRDLVEGMSLEVALRPAGCNAWSCPKIESYGCSSIGSDGTYWVSGFLCLEDSAVCTDECVDDGYSCAVGVTLSAGEYKVGVAGTTLSVEFSVPSHVTGDALCASVGDP